MEVVENDQDVLVITEKGYGKKTPISEYRVTSRGGKGVKTLNVTDKNGAIVSFKTVVDNQDLMIITDEGIVIRMGIDQISTLGRTTLGVKLINLRDGQHVSSITVVEKEEDNDVLETQIQEDEKINTEVTTVSSDEKES